jgi:uncharacterized membrane protein YfcA
MITVFCLIFIIHFFHGKLHFIIFDRTCSGCSECGSWRWIVHYFSGFYLCWCSSIQANASSTVALFPGSLASAWKFKEYIQPFPNISITAMVIFTLLGGCAGGLLLLYTPSADFKLIIPWLLLLGSLAFAFGKQAGNWLRKRIKIGSGLVLGAQFILGIYGGYFGGAVGIMMMAVWALFGLSDIKIINANKTLFTGIANAAAVILFISADKIYWPKPAP